MAEFLGPTGVRVYWMSDFGILFLHLFVKRTFDIGFHLDLDKDLCLRVSVIVGLWDQEATPSKRHLTQGFYLKKL